MGAVPVEALVPPAVVPVGTRTVLVIEDEATIAQAVAARLRSEGFAVEVAVDGPGGVDACARLQPDLVVLDLMLPGIDGIEVCRQLRTFCDAYVLMLTARSEEIDRVVGLTVGADDYLAKPFSPRELVARVKALLRRPRTSPTPAAAPVLAHGLEVDVARHVVRVDGATVELTPLEFGVLAVLASEPGVVVSRARIFDEVWDEGPLIDNHLVDVHVANLRRKLGDDPERPRFVETVRGVGYRLRDPSA
jgi:DNA-binding response OmpR family regulator